MMCQRRLNADSWFSQNPFHVTLREWRLGATTEGSRDRRGRDTCTERKYGVLCSADTVPKFGASLREHDIAGFVRR